MMNWKKLLALLTMTLTLALGCACMAYAAEPGEIHVKGIGVVLADPDTADIRLSVESMGKTAEIAQKENNRILQKVTTALMQMGVTKENIVTTYTSVYPQYTYHEETGQRSVTGYSANTNLQITTKEINHTGTFIDAALKAGATGSNGVSFSLSDQSAVYGQALQLAAKNAEKSAASIANAFGKQLGAVKSITENSGNAYAAEETMNYGLQKAEAVADSAGGTAIHYSKLQIAANLSVTYEIA